MEKQLWDMVESIKSLDQKAMDQAKMRWDSIAKPLHSLGKLEDMVVQMAGINRTHKVSIKKKCLIIMCADNGVVEEGVTQTGQEVTAIVSENFNEYKATASVLCRQAGVDIYPIDIGIAQDTSITNKKIAYGTKNMAKEPAMTREQALKGILTGIEAVKEKKLEGYEILATGEMGIGNTTTSSAIASVLLQQPVEEMTGRGAGLSSAGLQRKIKVIKEAIKIHKPNKEDPIDVLSKIGGFDIAGMVGIFLGGAIYQVPVVLDGFISAVAALVASLISKECLSYMVASHVSKEPAASYILESLGLKPCIICDMCLGEGTGAITLFPMLDMGIAVYNNMSTFQENSIENYIPQD